MSGPTRPRVTLKLATTLDGRIATQTGESQWITGPEARAETHKMRAANDAILVGAETALADDPELTARTDPASERQPVRIVADSRLRLLTDARLIQTLNKGPVVLAAGVDAEESAEDALIAAGAEVWRLAIAPMGGVSVSSLLSRCGQEGIDSVFLEGGGRLAASFLKLGAVDRIEWFRAPKIIGDDGRACVAALGVEALADVPQFARTTVCELGPDLWETYERAD
ncbi:MAG: RibD family protein [Pseudomonadota bacterium]